MATFRSRQRAQLRRDTNSRDPATGSPAGGQPAIPSSNGPLIQKKPSSGAPSNAAPREPYAGRRPGPAGGKPSFGRDNPRQDEGRRFERNERGNAPRFERRDDERKPFNREHSATGAKPPFNREAPRQGEGRRFERDERGSNPHFERRDDERKPYSRDRGPSGPKPLFGQSEKPQGEGRRFERDERGSNPRFERRDDERKPYSRDRGPSGPKPLFGQSDKPQGEGRRFERDERGNAPRSEPRNDERKPYSRDRGPSGPKPLFGHSDKPQGEGRRFERDERSNAPRSEPRNDERKPYSRDRGPSGPKPLFGHSNKPQGEGRRFERDERSNAPRANDTDARQSRWHYSDNRQPGGLKPLAAPHRLETPHGRQQRHQADAQHKPARSNTPSSPAPAMSQARLKDAELGLFAPCPRGLEGVLAKELTACGAQNVEATDGGVRASGNLDVIMRTNLMSRTASRILLKLAEGPYHSEHDINRLAMSIDWPRWFDVNRSIKVKTDGIGTTVRSLDYISLTVKDAICDRFRLAQLGRPNVDTRQPDMRIHTFLTRDHAIIYLDTSGEPLFKRGWREETGEAPLRENLAAGILLLAGYDGSQPLIDPLCGSGTFLVEAADIALQRAPGRLRRFAFQKLREFDALSWEALQTEARLAEKPLCKLAIAGSDRDAEMIRVTRHNLELAGLATAVDTKVQDILDVRPTAPHGLIVSNPPYGVRLDEQDALAAWYPQLGTWLKSHFAGWTVHLLSGDLRLAKLIHLSPKRRTPLYNGSLECRLFMIQMVAGSARREKPSADEQK